MLIINLIFQFKLAKMHTFKSLFEKAQFLDKKNKNDIFIKIVKSIDNIIENEYTISSYLKSPVNLKKSSKMINRKYISNNKRIIQIDSTVHIIF